MEHTAPRSGATAHPQAEPPRPSNGAGRLRFPPSAMWVIPLAVLVVVGGMFAWWRPPVDTGLTGMVERGDLIVRLTETGVLANDDQRILAMLGRLSAAREDSQIARRPGN